MSVSIVVGERNPAVGKPFSLPCHVAGSRPIPKITWWKNDILLDPSTHNQVKNLDAVFFIFFYFFFSAPLHLHPSLWFDTKWRHSSQFVVNEDGSTFFVWAAVTRFKLSQWLWLYYYYYYYSLLFVFARQTLSINGSVAVSVLDLSLDKTEMNSRIKCRAVNPYLDSTVMEDTWNVNLSCKSICVSFSIIFIYLFISLFCPGLCNAHPSASLENNPIVAQVLWFAARQPMIFSFLWIDWVWLLILHFYYSNDRSTIVAIVVRV